MFGKHGGEAVFVAHVVPKYNASFTFAQIGRKFNVLFDAYMK